MISFADVILEAAKKRAEHEAHANQVKEARWQELKTLAEQADKAWRRGYQNDELWDHSYSPINFQNWYEYIMTSKRAGIAPGKIAEHISTVESKPCSYRQINGVIAMLSKQAV